MADVRAVQRDDLRSASGAVTPGMRREEAFAGEGHWVGRVRTAPGVVSGWHHHGDYDTFIYVASGEARVEFGPGGRRVAGVRSGAFVFIPRGAVHRETNTGANESELVLVRIGRGEPVVNVEGPEPG